MEAEEMEADMEDETIEEKDTLTVADILKKNSSYIINVARMKAEQDENEFAMQLLSEGVKKYPNGEKMRLAYITFCREMCYYTLDKFDELEKSMMMNLRNQLHAKKLHLSLSAFDALFLPFEADEIRRINLLNVEMMKPKGKIVEISHPRPKFNPRRIIRLCYISSGLRDHTTTHLIQGVLREHDKTKFHVTCISTVNDEEQDQFRENLKCFCTDYICMPQNMNPKETANYLEKFNFDIIIDLIGPTYTSVLQSFNYKPSPIIVEWLGYPATSGQQCIDYIIIDRQIAPWPLCSSANEKHWFVEQPAHMPNSYFIGDHMNMFPHLKYSTVLITKDNVKLILNSSQPISTRLQSTTEIEAIKNMLDDNTPKIILHGHTIYNGKELYAELPQVAKGLDKLLSGIVVTCRSQYGIGENQIVYGNFNYLKKMTKLFMTNFVKVLHAVENSLLWLVENPKFAIKNLRDFLVENGLNENRIFSSPYEISKEEHIRRGVIVDLFVDPWVCNGHTTSLDALWSGTPLLTLTGDTFHTRVSTSLLYVLRLPVLYVATPQDFVERAIFLGTNIRALTRLRDLINTRKLTSPLFDVTNFVWNLESLYAVMWRAYTKGNIPGHIPADEECTEWMKLMPAINEIMEI